MTSLQHLGERWENMTRKKSRKGCHLKLGCQVFSLEQSCVCTVSLRVQNYFCNWFKSPSMQYSLWVCLPLCIVSDFIRNLQTLRNYFFLVWLLSSKTSTVSVTMYALNGMIYKLPSNYSLVLFMIWSVLWNLWLYHFFIWIVLLCFCSCFVVCCWLWMFLVLVNNK